MPWQGDRDGSVLRGSREAMGGGQPARKGRFSRARWTHRWGPRAQGNCAALGFRLEAVRKAHKGLGQEVGGFAAGDPKRIGWSVVS